MEDFIPFFTQDGSVGLYNKSDNDIYHSVYGALSEAYDKFILPVDFYNYFQNKKYINVLDICYGIGYNSKTFLNYFLKNFFQKKIQNFHNHAENTETIHTDNILISKCNNSIYTNNILQLFIKKNYKTELKKSAKYDFLKNNDSDNQDEFEKCKTFIKENNKNKNDFLKDKISKYVINIDAVDTNKSLIMLSPFFKYNSNLKSNEKFTGIKKIDKYLSANSKIKRMYKLSNDCNFIILKSLIDIFGYDSILENYKKFIIKTENRNFIDENMLDFMKFYQNYRYNLSSCQNKSTFLHNIYYRYLSCRYKNQLNVLDNSGISLKFHTNDARQFVLKADKKYDVIFLDAFTPSKCPSLWTYEFFDGLYKILNDDGVILTYTNSSAVRNAMLKNNFYVGKIFNQNENKFTGTVASKNKNTIVYFLNDYELGLLNTNSGIVYHDYTGKSSNKEILDLRKEELNKSNLMSATQYIKRNRINEI